MGTEANLITRDYSRRLGAPCVVCSRPIVSADGNYVCNSCVWVMAGRPLGREGRALSWAELDEMNALPRPLVGAR